MYFYTYTKQWIKRIEKRIIDIFNIIWCNYRHIVPLDGTIRVDQSCIGDWKKLNPHFLSRRGWFRFNLKSPELSNSKHFLYFSPSNACDHVSSQHMFDPNQVLLQGLLNKVILEVDMFTSSMLNWILANFFVPKSSLKMIISAKFLNINS